ncbi:MAG: DUF115 domain-containing protein [Spirochaetaceae bacterium]|jgi:hypothetical protein|nr:DUF115 domain-containing protein [Spirochaetaceae bacterium]
MTTYEKNMRAVRRIFGGLADLLPAAPAPELTVHSAAGGLPTLTFRGKLLHSARDAAKEAARIVQAEYQKAPPGAQPFFVILGFGLGYAAQAAAELAPQSPIVIVEKHPALLRAALETHDWSAFLSERHIVFVLAAESAAIFPALNAAAAFLPAGHKKPVLIKNHALVELDAAWYHDITANIAVWENQNTVNAATRARFEACWTRNLCKNMAAMRGLPDVRRLFGILTLTDETSPPPALLVAAGPSLDKLAAHLAQLRERFVIVAVDTALRFLRRAGVQPDFALSMDAQYWNARHLDNCARFTKTRFIFDPAIQPRILRDFAAEQPARAFLCEPNVPAAIVPEAERGKRGKLAAGGSVATSAWDFCRAIGASELWAAGLDLAYPEGRTHYRDAFFEERARTGANRLRPAEQTAYAALHTLPLFDHTAADGTRVYTDIRLKLYAAWFADMAGRYPAFKCRLLNPAGLAIPAFSPAAIEEALAKPPCRPAIDAAIATLAP